MASARPLKAQSWHHSKVLSTAEEVFLGVLGITLVGTALRLARRQEPCDEAIPSSGDDLLEGRPVGYLSMRAGTSRPLKKSLASGIVM